MEFQDDPFDESKLVDLETQLIKPEKIDANDARKILRIYAMNGVWKLDIVKRILVAGIVSLPATDFISYAALIPLSQV